MQEEQVFVGRALLRSLSQRQRDVLIAHIDGPRPRVVQRARNHENENAITMALIRRRLLRGLPENQPRQTELTESGRSAVATILAEYAEALVAAGFLHGAPALRPIEVLRALRERDKRGAPAMLENFLPAAGQMSRDSF